MMKITNQKQRSVSTGQTLIEYKSKSKKSKTSANLREDVGTS